MPELSQTEEHWDLSGAGRSAASSWPAPSTLSAPGSRPPDRIPGQGEHPPHPALQRPRYGPCWRVELQRLCTQVPPQRGGWQARSAAGRRVHRGVGMGAMDILKSRQLSSQLLVQKVGLVNGQVNYFSQKISQVNCQVNYLAKQMAK